MIGSDILVLPESGPSFLRAVKAGSLYSVRVFSPLLSISAERATPMLERAETFCRNGQLPECARPFLEKTLSYFRFIIDNERSLRLLADTGILSRPNVELFEQAVREPSSTPSPSIDAEGVVRILKDKADPRVITLQRAFAECPPTMIDLIPLSPHLALFDKSWTDLSVFGSVRAETLAEWFVTVPEFRLLIFAVYLTSLSYESERDSVVMLCTSDLHQQAVWAARDAFGVGHDGNPLAQRKSIQAQIGDAVIQRYLPDVDSLEFEDILELRTKCRGELEALRIGLNEIAAQVDTTQPVSRQRLEIEDVISAKVDPAVRNLQVSLWAAKADILKKITSSWDSLAKATVPFLVSVAVGAPMNMQATLAAIGGLSAIAGPFIESEVERRKLLHASQWSVLLRLKKLGT